MIIKFGMGIIKGRYKDNSLEILLENKRISSQNTVEINKKQFEEFLSQNDYVVRKGKNGCLSFDKIFVDNKLGDYLKSNGISQAYIASKLGVSRAYINQLCSAANLELATAYPILKALNLQVSDIDLIFPPKNLELFEF